MVSKQQKAFRDAQIIAQYESIPEELRSIKYTARLFNVSARTVSRALKNHNKK